MRVAGLALGLALGHAGRTWALFASGQLLTNIASVTFAFPNGSGGAGMPSVGPDFHGFAYSQSVFILATDYPMSCLKMYKTTPTAIVNPGDIVTWRVSVSNCGWMTHFDVTVTDAVPANTTIWSPLSGSWGGAGGGSWSTTQVVPPGQAGPFKLQWVLDRLAMRQTAWIEYQTTIQ